MTPKVRTQLGWGARLALISTLSSCTYITQRAYEDKRDGIDGDGDGAAWHEDCDDADATRSPGLPEVPYDGIDNDCGQDGDQIDADGDGYPGITDVAYAALQPPPVEPFPAGLVGKPLDCVDDPAVRADASQIHPEATTEIPYDGVDSDCDGANDFDADADGWMPATVLDGIDVATAFGAYVADWGYEDRVAGWAPPGGAAPVVGDCDDFRADVHPDPAVADLPYDGIDHDCDGANDFDQDGDGWMPAQLPDGSDTFAAYDQYVLDYFDRSPPWTLPADIVLPDGTALGAFDDCLDQAHPELDVAPAEVHPVDTLDDDVWYDGVDANCWADNDFDRDADGFLPEVLPDGTRLAFLTTLPTDTAADTAGDTGAPPPLGDVAAAYADYVRIWGYEDRESEWGAPANLLVPGLGDCEDADPDTYPQALETVGDGQDQDCDGNSDAAAFAFGGWLWDRPSAPRVERIGDTYVWALTGRQLDLGGGSVLHEVGVGLSVPLSAATNGTAPVISQFKLADDTRPVDAVIDIAPVPTPVDLTADGVVDAAAWFSTTWTAEINGYTYLHGRLMYEHSGSGAITLQNLVSNYTETAYSPSSITVSVNDDGEPYVIGCADDQLHVIEGLDPQPTDPELEIATADQGGLCFVTGDPSVAGADELVAFTRCTGTQCRSFPLQRNLGTNTLAMGAGTLTGELWIGARRHGALQILVDSAGVVVRDEVAAQDYALFSGASPISADAVLVDGELFVAAVLDEGPDRRVELAYGPPGAVTTSIPMPFVADEALDVVPEGIALHADQDRVVIVVTARDRAGTPGRDAVGWMFLGKP